MAGESPAPEHKRRFRSRQSPRLLPYVIALLVAVSLFGYYWFEYIPSRTDYFLGLRFRTLALMSSQVKAKAESLNSAIKITNGLTASTDLDAYAARLLPDLRRSKSGLDLDNQFWVRWGDLFREARSLNSEEAGFDDVLIADKDGTVIYEMEGDSPRIGSLKDLNYRAFTASAAKPTDAKGSPPTSPPPPPLASTFTTVQIGANDEYILLHPFRFDFSDKTYYIAGLVAMKNIQSQALHVPRERFLLTSWLLILVLLTLPFIKLFTLSETERVGLKDFVAAAVCSTLLFASCSLLFFLPSVHTHRTERNLEHLAEQIDENMAVEFDRWWHLLTAIRDSQGQFPRNELAQCAVGVAGFDQRSCSALPLIRKIAGDALWNDIEERGGLNPDVLFWIDREGNQVSKITTREQMTAQFQVNQQDYFKKILERRLWNYRSVPDETFIVEPVQSPTTSEMAFGFAIPAVQVVDYDGEYKEVVGLAINSAPLSLVDPLIPPEYGFAVVDMSGRVLFHSRPERSLHENFLDETGNSSELTSLLQHRQSGSWDGDYRGEPYSVFIKPVESIENCPWSIVAFRGREQLLNFQARQQTGGMLLSVIGISIPIALAFLGLLAQRIFQGRSFRTSVMGKFWPVAHRARSYRFACVYLALLAIASVGMIVAAATADLSWSNVLLWYFLLVPTAAFLVLLTVHSCISPEAVSPDLLNDSDYGWWRCQIVLLMICVSLLPSAGHALLSLGVEDKNRLEDWLFHSSDGQYAREERLKAAAESSRVLDPDTRDNLARMLTIGSRDTPQDCLQCHVRGAPKLFSYHSYLRNISVTNPPDKAAVQPTWAESTILRLNELLTPRHAFEPGAVYEDRNRVTFCSGAPVVCMSGLKRPFTEFITGSHWLMFLVLIGIVAALWKVLGTLVLAGSETSTGRPRRQWSDLEAILKETDDSDITELPKLIYLCFPGERAEAVVESYEWKAKPAIIGIDSDPAPTLDLLNAKKQEALNAGRKVYFIFRDFDEALRSDARRPSLLALVEDLLADSRVGIVLESRGDTLPMKEDPKVRELLLKFTLASAPPLEPDDDQTRCHGTYDPWQWKLRLLTETKAFPALQRIRLDLEKLWSTETEVSEEILIFALEQRARPFFETIWHHLSRSERLVVVQVAEGCFPNPRAISAITELKRKRLLIMHPQTCVFSESFRRFLVERDHVNAIHRWERESRRGFWRDIRAVIGFASILAVVFYGLTQGRTVESLVTLVLSTGAALFPKFGTLFAKIPGVSSGGGSKA